MFEAVGLGVIAFLIGLLFYTIGRSDEADATGKRTRKLMAEIGALKHHLAESYAAIDNLQAKLSAAGRKRDHKGRFVK
jgi:hypothetical protein